MSFPKLLQDQLIPSLDVATIPTSYPTATQTPFPYANPTYQSALTPHTSFNVLSLAETQAVPLFDVYNFPDNLSKASN